MNSSCAECGAGISVPNDAIVGEIVSCRDCSSEYEVAELSNGTALLKPAEQVGEDWGE
jgi:alpha-aminoadipate/glutamate carrier protein LysW